MFYWLIASVLATSPLLGAIVCFSFVPSTRLPLKRALITALAIGALVVPIFGYLPAMILAAFVLIGMTFCSALKSDSSHSLPLQLFWAITSSAAIVCTAPLMRSSVYSLYHWAGYRNGVATARRALTANRDYELFLLNKGTMWCRVDDPYAPVYASFCGTHSAILDTLPTQEDYQNRAIADLYASGAQVYQGHYNEIIAVSLEHVVVDDATLRSLRPLRELYQLILSQLQNVTEEELASSLSNQPSLKEVWLVGKNWSANDAARLRQHYGVPATYVPGAPPLPHGQLYSPSKSSP